MQIIINLTYSLQYITIYNKRYVYKLKCSMFFCCRYLHKLWCRENWPFRALDVTKWCLSLKLTRRFIAGVYTKWRRSNLYNIVRQLTDIKILHWDIRNGKVDERKGVLPKKLKTILISSSPLSILKIPGQVHKEQPKNFQVYCIEYH